MEEYYIINARLVQQGLTENVLSFIRTINGSSESFSVSGYKLKTSYFEVTYDTLYDEKVESFKKDVSSITELKELLDSNIFSDIVMNTPEYGGEVRLSLSMSMENEWCLAIIMDAEFVNGKAPEEKKRLLENISMAYFSKIKSKHGNGSTESSCLDSEMISYPEEYQREDLYYLPPDVKVNIDTAKYRVIELTYGKLYIRVS